MLAVKSGNVEIKHGKSEVGQIKLEKWVSECLEVHARRWGQQRNIIRGELEHESHFFSRLKTVLVVFLLQWTQYFGIKEREKKENKGGDS